MNLAVAIAAASAFWGQPADCPQVHHRVGYLPPPALGRTFSRWPCLVRISDRIRRQKTLCWVVRHEWGHLHDRHHSTVPGTLMYPVIPAAPPPCWTWRP